MCCSPIDYRFHKHIESEVGNRNTNVATNELTIEGRSAQQPNWAQRFEGNCLR